MFKYTIIAKHYKKSRDERIPQCCLGFSNYVDDIRSDSTALPIHEEIDTFVSTILVNTCNLLKYVYLIGTLPRCLKQVIVFAGILRYKVSYSFLIRKGGF